MRGSISGEIAAAPASPAAAFRSSGKGAAQRNINLALNSMSAGRCCVLLFLVANIATKVI